MSRWVVLCSLLTLACATPGQPMLRVPAPAAPGQPEPEDLRESLTEREDRRRPPEPWSVPLAGRPLTVSGEYELVSGALWQGLELDGGDDDDTFLLEQELETELFYSFGPRLSLFAQARLAMEMLDGDTEVFAERGEMWLHSEDLAGSGISVECGRLNFEDERRWWWDQELDGLRLDYEAGEVSISFAAAYELGPSRSDASAIEPSFEDVLRLFGEASWDWRQGHVLEVFLLYQDDFSPQEIAGKLVDEDRQDESDARLGWLGLRGMGVVALGRPGRLGYWLDAALVAGEERLLPFETDELGRSVAGEMQRIDLRGWAVDAGLSWILPLAGEPRLFVGHAHGSGDSSPGPDRDRSFRQSGLETNEAGFGGVQRFSHYGVLLEPELSNLDIATAGAGLSFLRSSSLDLVYHHYRQAEPAETLRSIRFDSELGGTSRDVGHELDLVLALEEWTHFELELVGSAFRAGRAFEADRGEWTFGGFVSLRYAF
ncbi:MAG: alginate export family protein [Deltaproteobacteria bacterium]|nr:alginate export family protein [Deltaproteobacteria bacterium]